MARNNKQKVLILRGLPASGKTTYARALEEKGWIRVEKDDIRKDGRLFKNGVYNHKHGDEGIVIKERNRQIRQALDSGKNVVSSDTNLKQQHITSIAAIAREFGAQVDVKDFFDVPLAELIERDAARDNTVGEQVIRRMFHESVKKMPTALKYDPSLPFLVVSDLDGTLTLGPKDRSPYEWHKVGQDDINLGVAHMLDGVNIIGYAPVYIFSGRDGVCRPETEEWLERHDIEYDKLVMRAEGDDRSDAIVKAEFIEKYIRGKFNVLIWLDDRVRVANMLRDVYGINVAQLGDPNFAF